MSVLNLMGNKLKPKEVNEVLEELTNAVSSLQTPTASSVTYSNTSSGLTADNVQTAIDELNSTKLNFGELTAFTKSDEVVTGTYPVNKYFICTIYQNGANGAVTTNLLYSAR